MTQPSSTYWDRPRHPIPLRDYTVGEKQLNTARQVLSEVQASEDSLAVNRDGTEAAKTPWAAEDYHQDYIAKTGRACHVNIPGAAQGNWSQHHRSVQQRTLSCTAGAKEDGVVVNLKHDAEQHAASAKARAAN